MPSLAVHYAAHTDPLFKKIGQLKLNDIFSLNLYRLYHKIINKTIPVYFRNVFDLLLPKQTTYNLRIIKLQFPPFKHDFARNGTFYQLILLINNKIESNIQNNPLLQQVETLNIKSYSSIAKKELLSGYAEKCNKTNCYSCNQK